MVLNNVVPAIKSKFPPQSGVIIQQDNASPHKCVTTSVLNSRGILGIEVKNQPPNSPDFNVLDLGFFNSIQSLQYQKSTRTIEELIDAVETSFYELPVDTVSKTFITLQKVMEKCIEIHGSNDYKLPHMKKDAMISDFTSFNVEFYAAWRTTIEEAAVTADFFSLYSNETFCPTHIETDTYTISQAKPHVDKIRKYAKYSADGYACDALEQHLARVKRLEEYFTRKFLNEYIAESLTALRIQAPTHPS
ncbi:hypothetical protein H257_05490 [Aphanomyces astaci]|uniref:Tc1-like transposase DDE domain-containing protein n=1 Tax=Aphanomyces astaci TaxID=112090 RepID=W4GQG2_APHAT|nr:hypothetical protein H257_05490 [Aphanomyces astaci]ETV81952.1 hypothetical protein H257_05490 [Aphanomyces astaci]|eukprot:XP_009828689.1 hypothetical protein H257_05490 [Aphanomyces astaci]